MAGIKLVTLNINFDYLDVEQKVTVMGYWDAHPSDYAGDLLSNLMQVEVKVISNYDCGDSSGGIGGIMMVIMGRF